MLQLQMGQIRELYFKAIDSNITGNVLEPLHFRP